MDYKQVATEYANQVEREAQRHAIAIDRALRTDEEPITRTMQMEMMDCGESPNVDSKCLDCGSWGLGWLRFIPSARLCPHCGSTRIVSIDSTGLESMPQVRTPIEQSRYGYPNDVRPLSVTG